MGFIYCHSVTYLGSKSEHMGSYSIVRSSYNMNEHLAHQYEKEYEKGYWRCVIVMVALGVGIGAFCSNVLFKKNFPSFWFFAILLLGVLGGFIAAAFLVGQLARRKQVVYERRQNGFTGRFVIIPEERWGAFQKALKTQSS